jgi:hypothetical protein
MAEEKLTLKQILGCVDMNYKGAWKEFSKEERKSISFWLLNRYVSSVSGSRANQENAIIKTNEIYNKHFNDIGVGNDTGHPELLWQLLCASGGTGKIEFHQWIGYKKRGTNNSKSIKLIEQIYPHLKDDEVEILAGISTKKELKQLAEKYGIENVKL